MLLFEDNYVTFALSKGCIFDDVGDFPIEIGDRIVES
jgi:hypothetical protein